MPSEQNKKPIVQFHSSYDVQAVVNRLVEAQITFTLEELSYEATIETPKVVIEFTGYNGFYLKSGISYLEEQGFLVA